MGNTLRSLLVRGAFLFQMRGYQSNLGHFPNKFELKISYLTANFENQMLSKATYQLKLVNWAVQNLLKKKNHIGNILIYIFLHTTVFQVGQPEGS